MNNIIHAISEFILPLSLIAGSLLAGIVVEKIILSRIMKSALMTKWKGNEFIISPLRKVIIIWFLMGGIHFAVKNIHISHANAEFVQKGIVIIFILSATIALSKILVGFVSLYSRDKGRDFPLTSIFTNLTKVIIFIVGGLIILQSLGISITPILTALGVGGLAVALALQDTLSNLFAGIHIIASRQVRQGDYIKLSSGEEGYVVDVNWRNTVIRALANNMVIIPNSNLAGALITNYYMPEKELAVLVQVGVSYGSDLLKVEQVTIEVAKEVMKSVLGGVPEFQPFTRYHTFGDFSVNFTVILRGKEFVDQYLIKHEFIKKLHERYKKEGIEIPFPVRTVYMREN
ncbi:MAG TPA: mechanosensitive ion channel family protein [bacterium]